jgi:hypothetical protein
MTTDINSIENRNNILDFIIKREDQVNSISINDIGRNKYEDLFLYFYLKKYREDEGYILTSKQSRALKKLEALYKSYPLNSPYLSDFYTSFKNIYDIAKSYKVKGASDENDDKIDKIADNFKKLYLLYNKDVYDDLENKDAKETVFKYIEKKVNKYKGGDYSKFATNKKEDDSDKIAVNFFEKAEEYSESNSKEIKEKIQKISEEKNTIAVNNMMYNIILKNLLFTGGNTEIKVAKDGVAVAKDEVAVAKDEVAEGEKNPLKRSVSANFLGGGDDSNKKTNEIIDILKDNKEKFDSINVKTKALLENKIENYIPYNNPTNSDESDINKTISSNIDLFDKYDKEIDELKNTKGDLDNYFKNIKTIYNNTIETIKGIDSNLLDARLKKYIKEINKFPLNDIDINNVIKSYDKNILQYDKNKERYGKTIKNLEDSIKHLRNKEIEREKAKQPIIGRPANGGASITLKDLKYLIDLIDNVIKILKSKTSSSDNSGNGTINIDSSLFENIWSQYNKYVEDVSLGSKPNKTTMDAEDNLYDQINMNNLNPADVLKVNYKDKYVFCALIFFVRLFIVVIVNLLIEYNIIKRLETALITFVIAYVLIIIIIAIIVNLDTYKLRILLNYFNINMNINLLILHLFIVVVFFILILIIVFDNQTDKYRNKFNSIYDFSYMYYMVWNLFNSKIDNEEVKNSVINVNISNNEKLKIQYKFEILTMIVYVFSSIIVLIS